MRKFYKKLLIVFVLYVLFVNIVTTFVSLNPRQLINFAFYDTRTLSLLYFAKNIILESGIKPVKTTIDEQLKFVATASEEHGINPELLKLLISPDDEYRISLTGGIGLTRINPYSFFRTGYKDPFVAKDNINATALVLKRLSLNSFLHQSELPRAFLTENLNAGTIRKFSSQTNNLIYTLTKKYNDYISSQKEEKMDINIFNIQ